MDYDVIWESKEIADCENGDIATLIKRKEVIEFLYNLQKVGKTENVEQESICNKIQEKKGYESIKIAKFATIRDGSQARKAKRRT